MNSVQTQNFHKKSTEMSAALNNNQSFGCAHGSQEDGEFTIKQTRGGRSSTAFNALVPLLAPALVATAQNVALGNETNTKSE